MQKVRRAGLATLLWGLEMFSRLRFLRKPVEYYVVPDLRHGSHILQNPRQLLAAQSRALDWWLFWLKGEEDVSDPAKAPQYEQWRRLRLEREVDRARPRAARLRWSVEPEQASGRAH